MSETQNKELAKSYDPASIEAKWYPFWEKQGYFKAGLAEGKPSFSIQLPPPNITGILHMGHAFNHSVMDSLTRFYRMNGYNTMWLPGTDHAGIATQIVVERKLEAQGKNRRDMPRDEFVREIWKWKDYSGGNILNQMRRLGDTLDWDRLYFTMNDDLAKVVVDCFVDLYEKGLIYRGRRLVNWDPKLQTSVSDLEVEPKEMDGHLWEIRYPAADGSEGVVVATTRPETMFGDQAVAVNPEDERYKGLVGKKLKLPLTDREIPVIADDYVDKEFGSGCVKITPAHDFNDFEVGKRHNLEQVNIMTKTAHLNDNVPEKYRGMDRYEARKAVIEDLKAQGLLVGIKPHKHMVPLVPRTGEVVEPMISEQWFLAMSQPAPEGSRYPGKSLSDLGLEAVQENLVNIFPEQWQKVYKDWLSNIQDWCLSRQLWWGHQIPAYYLPEGGYVVAATKEEALELARKKTGNSALQTEDLRQDEDCLDTWFSSWLWPISLFDGINHPGNEELNYYYPTSDLVTAPDIIFFWVARMIIAGYEYQKEMPFKNVYFTGIVRDKLGRKMSKSLGNSPDPLELIDRYGADGVRMGMMLSAPAGNDILFDDTLCEQGRNFNNKIWNAFRLVKGWSVDSSIDQPESAKIAVRWFDAMLKKASIEIADLFSKYRLSEALMVVYKLFWDEFSSWYLEMIKPGYQQPIDATTYEKTLSFFDDLLKLLHPFMPFITEELWQHICDRKEGESIMIAQLPGVETYDEALLAQIETAKEIISGVRSIRLQKNIPNKDTLELQVIGQHNSGNDAVISKLANLSAILSVNEKDATAASFLVGTTEYAVPLGNNIDVEAELKKQEEELKYLQGFLKSVIAKLSNERFVNNAPAQVVEMERKKQSDAESKIKSLEESIAALKK